MTLSIIIVNYNGIKFLKECLDSINLHCSSFDYEIIIWDNNSQDESVSFLQKQYGDDIKLIISKQNLGFSGGNNGAGNLATGEYVLLLNNDTKLLLNPLKAVYNLNHKTFGALSYKMLGKNGEYRFSAGRFPNPLRLFKLSLLFEKRGGFKTGEFKSNKPLEVDWIEGSFLLTKLSTWRKLGGLDEDYFMYAEDIDLCRRIRNNGLKIYYVPENGYIHHGGYGNDRQEMLFRSLNLYLDKHTGGFFKYLHKFALRTNLLIKNVKGIIKKTT